MSGINTEKSRHLLQTISLLALLLCVNAAKKQGQITYEATPTDAKSTTGTKDVKEELDSPIGERQIPSGSSPVLPKMAYPGDLSAFFASSLKEVTPVANRRPASRRSGESGYGERRSRTRRPTETLQKDKESNSRINGNPYLDAAESSPLQMEVVNQKLPGYDAPKGVSASKLMETEAELTYEGAGFLPGSQGTSSSSYHDASPKLNQASEERMSIAAQDKRNNFYSTTLNPEEEMTSPSNLINAVTVVPYPRNQFYGQLSPQESTNYQQAVQVPAPPRSKPRQPIRQESSPAFHTHFSRGSLLPSGSSNIVRGPIPHFGIPIQIPPTYSFYPTIGQKGYYVTQESAPGTFVQTERRDGVPADFIRYGKVPDHIFQRIKREVEAKTSKTAPIKKGSSKLVKLSLSKFVLEKYSQKANKTSITAIPSHLSQLSKSDSKLESESSEYIPSFGSYPFFRSEHGGIASPAGHTEGFGVFGLNEESRGPRSGHTYGARPRRRGRGHRGPSYRASESRSFGYGLLGSGNFEVVRGGIYSDNRPSASRVPMHHGAESYGGGGGGYDFDDVDDEPILGFQGYNNFGALHNALASKKRVTAVVPVARRADHAHSSSQLIETTVDMDAVD